MIVALTGGTGLLGRVLIPALAARGHRVRALARPRAGRELEPRPDLEWISGQLDELDAVEHLVEGCDCILHAAYQDPGEPAIGGISAAEDWFRANYLGTLRLLERTVRARAKQLIYVSSLHVYGDDPNRDPLGERYERDETFPIWPLDFYGAQRAGMEKIVLAAAHTYGWNTSVFRLGWVLGLRAERERQPFAPMVAEAREHGELRTSCGGHVIAVEDAAQILADAVGDAALSGLIFNTFDRYFDFADVAPLLEEILGRSVRVACERALPPRSPILAERIHARYESWRTDECIRALLVELAGRVDGE